MDTCSNDRTESFFATTHSPDEKPIAYECAEQIDKTNSPPSTSEKHSILSIDGGGVRCVIAMEVLCSLEKSIQIQSGDPHRTLSDEFDLIAGTSAGGMLASAIALGMPMSEIRVFVECNIQDWFAPARWFNRHKSLYDKSLLANALQSGLGGNVTLGSSELKTGLMLMTHNWSEDSEWLLTNRVGAAPDSDPDDSHLELLLWQVTLAGASAPAYFLPEKIQYGRRNPRDIVLQDGGMTGYLNPAFRAFRYATQSSKGPRWPTGEDQLKLVSLGSGDATHNRQPATSSRRGVMRAMLDIPNTLVQGSMREQDALCRLHGRTCSDFADHSASNDSPTDCTAVNMHHMAGKQFNYYRINPSLDTSNLASLGLHNVSAGQVMPMDKSENHDVLSQIGKRAAELGQTSVIAKDVLKLDTGSQKNLLTL